MKRIGILVKAALIAGFALAFASVASFAASEFEGAWAVNNTKGEPFEITLAADGTAKSTLPGARKSADRVATVGARWRGRTLDQHQPREGDDDRGHRDEPVMKLARPVIVMVEIAVDAVASVGFGVAQCVVLPLPCMNLNPCR